MWGIISGSVAESDGWDQKKKKKINIACRLEIEGEDWTQKIDLGGVSVWAD